MQALEVEILRRQRRAVVELGRAERVQQQAAQLARLALLQHVEHVGVGLVGKGGAPIVAVANLAVERCGDLACALGIGRGDVVNIEPVQDGLGNAAGIVGGGNPDHATAVDRHFGEFVGESARGIGFEQAV